MPEQAVIDAPADAEQQTADAASAQPADLAGASQAETPAGESTPAQPAPSKLDLVREAIDSGELDPREFIKSHPKLASAWGNVLEDERKQRERQEDQQRLTQLAQQRLVDDPDDPLAQRQLADSQAAQQQLARNWLVDYLGEAGTKEYDESPDLAAIRGKEIDPISFLKAIAPLRDKHAVEALVQDRLAEEKAKWIKEETPAIEKQVLARLNGGEPGPDLEQGATATGGLTKAGYLAMSFADRRKLQAEHPEQIDAMNAA